MTLQITANPRRQSAFGITANTRRSASVGSRVSWESVYGAPASLDFLIENVADPDQFPNTDNTGAWQYSDITDAARNVLDDATYNAMLTTITATRAESGAAALPVLTKLRELPSVKDFGAVGDGTTDDTAAFNAALAIAKLIRVPTGNYKITSALTVSANGGMIGEGEGTKLIRFFTGGRLIGYPGGEPIILRDFRVQTDASVTVASGDTGIDIGYTSAWTGRGEISNILIVSQYDGFKWKGGSVNSISGIVCIGNKGHGFYGVNPRGELLFCHSEGNEGDGYRIHAFTAGETGVRLVHCGTFANQGYGLKAIAEAAVTGANLWTDQFSSSYDRAGGIYCDDPYTQVYHRFPFVEYAGTDDATYSFAAVTTAAGILINDTSIVKHHIHGGAVMHCQGRGVVIAGAEVDIDDMLIASNGMSSTVSHTVGLELGAGCTVTGGDLRFENDSGTQTTDISISSATAAGHLDKINGTSIFDVGGSSVRLTNLSGTMGEVVDLTAAATLALPSYGTVFNVAGATGISAISGGWAGRRATLIFASNPQLTHSSSLYLPFAANYTATAGSHLELVCDGTNWFVSWRELASFPGVVNFTNTTQATAYDAAAAEFAGGVGIAKNLFIGDATATSTATPNQVNLGGTYADGTTAVKSKVKLFDNGSSVHGMGVTLGQTNYFVPSGSTFNWFVNDVLVGSLSSTALAFTTSVKSSGAGGIGYATGAGGTQTQGTSKATAVTLDKVCGTITTHNANLGAATIVSFVLNNSTIAATDQIVVTHESGGTTGAYTVNGRATGAGTAAIDIRNNTAGILGEALVLRFSVIKGVST